MEIIAHNLSEVSVGQRKIDGYINATALTTAHQKATGQRKDVANWLSNKRVQQTLKHLSSVTEIPVTALYHVFQGGNPQSQGTWLHPKLSVRLAMWLSDDFGYQVENWIETWMTTGKTPSVPTRTEPPAVILPTEKQLEFMRSRAWERAEIEGKPMSATEIRSQSGYDIDTQKRLKAL